MGTFIFVLSVLVVFHELGHYLAARYFGVTVESFSIGFGPRLLGFKRNGTDFKVCLLPIGGYVKMAGMTVTGTPTGDPGELMAKPRWQRLIIIAMGPIFNFILAIALLAGLYMHRYERAQFLDEEPRIDYVEPGSPADEAGLVAGDVVRSLNAVPTPTWKDLAMETALVTGRPVDIEFERDGVARRSGIEIPANEQMRGLGDPGWSERHWVLVGDVVEGSPAEAAGIKAGDFIVGVNGEEIVAVNQAIRVVGASEGRPLSLEVLRDEQRVALEARAARLEEDGAWRVGVRLIPRHDFLDRPLPFRQALGRSAVENYGYAGLIFRTLQSLMVGDVSLNSLEGPVGIYEHTKDAASYGAGPLLQLMALISINLGIVNLVPIPVLDGGHILLLLVESMLRRDVSMAVKLRITQLGLVFIMILFGIVMYNDLMRKFFPP
jgi:regulator of sigma E protease